MRTIKILAPAKINLALDVLKKSANGYHKIQTVYHEIPEIFDTVMISDSKIFDSTSILYAPSHKYKKQAIHPRENLGFKALKLLKKTYKIKKFADIKIIKRIPVSSGLGGASSDAAAVLKGLNKLWNLKLSQKNLMSIAEKLGKDAPFFLVGGTALGKNFGEKITKLKPIKNLKFGVVKKSSSSKNKTKNLYRKLNLKFCGKNTDKTKKLIEAIKKNDNKNIIKNIHNDFSIFYKLPKNTHLSGAGPSTFKIKI
ncbi:4-(cytidine 5'-diphospho)-2-C-methyl-D-erythritol kinase [Candidatus Peregrinibacteria bacterium RIFCSPLOWO2_01_FULL_39_12]|nr:MAG: 4-(cytidine 5'-diphospho)-2-C-methyl-D-erythritol kinase [Candidatus Peregrinibacteria bacterium RIFCSPLOWO2_01_FULL_39_12]OGJ42822.1 MAG: 4-(cytidine 5'-diphospho)-2-C-methyl-D-erythritol kinase [Candidatus Peregrinibacteria bacterium RIFCSPLOWO2_02_FULL_39_10]